MVAALVRTIFAQADREAVAPQLDEVASRLSQQFPEVAAMLLDTREDVCAFTAFPRAHWTKIWSTNSIERLNAGTQAPHQSGRDLPQRRQRVATHHGGLCRDPRGVAGCRKALHVRGLDGTPGPDGQCSRTGGDAGDYLMPG